MGRRLSTAPALALSGLAAFACNAISGVDDFSVAVGDGGRAVTDGNASKGDARGDSTSPADGSRARSGTDAVGDAPKSAGDATCGANLQTDPDNCGTCGHYCLGGRCAAGACQPVTLASAVGSVGLAIDATYVYWTNVNGPSSAINKIPKALTMTGTPTVVLSGAAYASVQAITTDGTYVYWTDKTASGSVQRALPTGLDVTTIASNQGNPDWIVSNGTTVFWTDESSNEVMSAPASAGGVGTPKQLNTTNELGTVPAGIAIDGTNVYYATKTSGGGIAESVPIAGGAVREIGAGTYVGIAVDAQNVYWTGGYANPTVSQNAKSGTPSTVKVIAQGALTCPLAIASDGVNVYFFDQGTSSTGTPVPGTGALYRVPVGNAGPLPPPLVSGLTDPQGMAVDDVAVYWVNGTSGQGGTMGSVMKVAK